MLQDVQQQLELALLQPPFYEEVIPLLASMQRDCQVRPLKSHDCHMMCKDIHLPLFCFNLESLPSMCTLWACCMYNEVHYLYLWLIVSFASKSCGYPKLLLFLHSSPFPLPSLSPSPSPSSSAHPPLTSLLSCY